MVTLFELRVFIFGLFMIALCACVSSDKRAEEKREIARVEQDFHGRSAEARFVAVDAGADSFLQIQFKHGTAEVAAKDQTRIREWLQKNSQRGNLTRVQVVAWADQEYPSVETRRLDDQQIRLARARADQLQNLLKAEAKSAKVQSYSMAERLSPAEEWYKIREGSLKKSLERSEVAVGEPSIPGSAQKGRALLLLQVQR